MRHLVLVVLLLGTAITAGRAQDAIPDLRGTWSGKGKAIVFGSNAHHPGSQTAGDPPRVHEIEAKYVIDGQDGRLVWGRSSSSVADTQEPFGWAIASDNKTIVGSDVDGYYHITLVSPDRIEKCYTQNGTSPSHSIIAACYMMDRVKQ
jgi:hypothetical protein